MMTYYIIIVQGKSNLALIVELKGGGDATYVIYFKHGIFCIFRLIELFHLSPLVIIASNKKLSTYVASYLG